MSMMSPIGTTSTDIPFDVHLNQAKAELKNTAAAEHMGYLKPLLYGGGIGLLGGAVAGMSSGAPPLYTGLGGLALGSLAGLALRHGNNSVIDDARKIVALPEDNEARKNYENLLATERVHNSLLDLADRQHRNMMFNERYLGGGYNRY